VAGEILMHESEWLSADIPGAPCVQPLSASDVT
jgi:hypothetical protein